MKTYTVLLHPVTNPISPPIYREVCLEHEFTPSQETWIGRAVNNMDALLRAREVFGGVPAFRPGVLKAEVVSSN